jgi:hypothetical protein
MEAVKREIGCIRELDEIEACSEGMGLKIESIPLRIRCKTHWIQSRNVGRRQDNLRQKSHHP